MFGFAKVFALLWGGSMAGKADLQLVFIYLLAHANGAGVVEEHPTRIALLTGLPIERVRDALAVLEAPDPESRTEAREGRRIERTHAHRDWGWSIINHAQYRGLRDEETRRAQNRDAQQRHRERQQASAAVSHGQPKTEVRSQKSEGRGQTTPEAGEHSARSQDGSMHPSPLFILMPLVGNDLWYTVFEDDVAEWQALFPGVDVPQSLRNQAAWLHANETRRKTQRGIRRFITNWLTSDQNSGRCRRGSATGTTGAAAVAAFVNGAGK